MGCRNENLLKAYFNKLKKISEKYREIVIQAPEGLKKKALEISRFLEDQEKDLVTYIISDPCYGACDLPVHKIKRLNCDLLIHLGHSPFYKKGERIDKGLDFDITYLEYRSELEIISVLEKNIGKIKESEIGLVSTVQHIDKLKEIKKSLEEAEKRAVIGGEGEKTGNRGQILGCDVTSALKIRDKVQSFIYVGSGDFHPLKLLETKKKIYKLNPYQKTFEVLDRDKKRKELRKDKLKALKYKNEKKWGILISSKTGQFSLNQAKKVRKKLESLEKEVYTFIGDRILETDLLSFGIEIFVNTACPRLSEDFERVIVINPSSLNVLERQIRS